MGIVVLTARTGHDDRVDGYKRGADLYLTKPVDSDELLLAIRNLARRLHGQDNTYNSPHVPAEGWCIDRLAYSLTCPNGIELDLTGREMQLLALLAEARGKPVSRTELSAELGYDDRPEARGIDAIIQRLKQKTLTAETELPIKAIRSVGISFAANVEIR